MGMEYIKALQANPALAKVFAGVIAMVVVSQLLQGCNHPNPNAGEQSREQARYPRIPKKMLFSGRNLSRIFPLGRDICKVEKWFGIPLSEDFHLLIYGMTGSGKSKMVLLNFLLSHLKKTPMLVVDIKGELHRYGTFIGDPHVRICSLTDSSRYGYDPLYMLSEYSTAEEVAGVMYDIACAIIPVEEHKSSDGFWTISARDMLQGLLTFFYRQGDHTLISCLTQIYSAPVTDTISRVKEECLPTDPEYLVLSKYFGMKEDAAVLHDTFVEMSTYTKGFLSNEALRYALDENPRKISPVDLLQGKSVFLDIPEEQLMKLRDVIRMILNQVLSELERRSHRQAKKKIMVIIDELGRISSNGKVNKLLDAAHTLRSRGCHLILATQDRESLIGPYTESEVASLENNMWKLILSASSSKTVAEVRNWVGMYKEKQQTWNDANGSVSTSYRDAYIVDGSDLNRLPDSGEAILIGPHGYFRFQKTYFETDPDIGPIAKRVRENNEIMLNEEL